MRARRVDIITQAASTMQLPCFLEPALLDSRIHVPEKAVPRVRRVAHDRPAGNTSHTYVIRGRPVAPASIAGGHAHAHRHVT